MKQGELDKLIKETDAIWQSLESHRQKYGDSKDAQEVCDRLKTPILNFKQGATELLREGQTLQIGIVGQMKAGKSSFLNSLFFDGESILPKAATPMTAGLTVIEYSETNEFVVEYFNEQDWQVFVEQEEQYQRAVAEIKEHEPDMPKSMLDRALEDRGINGEITSAHEMVEQCKPEAKAKIGAELDTKPFNDKKDLLSILEKYVGADGTYTQVVKSLYVKINDERLKGYRIVDTPGVNDPVVSRENRTNMFLRTCHGVIFLSSASGFFDKSDASFLKNGVGSQGISYVLILASKFDSVLVDLGVQAEMSGIKTELDLGETIEKQMQRFRDRLKEQLVANDIKLKEYKLDYNCGIGFSIAKKAPSAWDNDEKKSVENMKRHYPSCFTDEELKSTYEQLSNIEDIRDKYVDKWFIKNKESVISDKIELFFTNNLSGLSGKIGDCLRELSNKREILKATSEEGIRKQKEDSEKLFTALGDKVKSIVDEFCTDLQTNLRRLNNNTLDYIDVPLCERTKGFEHKGMLWGHNTTNISFNFVDIAGLEREYEKAVKSYSAEWRNDWRKVFDDFRAKFRDKVNDAIFEHEKGLDITSNAFNRNFYCDIIDKVVRELKLESELDLSKEVRSTNDQVRKITDNIKIPDSRCTYDCDGDRVRDIVENKAEFEIKRVRNSIDQERKCFEDDVKKRAEKSRKVSEQSLQGVSSSFANKLNEQCKQYLEDLEQKLKRQSDAVAELDELIKIVGNLEKTYKV